MVTSCGSGSGPPLAGLAGFPKDVRPPPQGFQRKLFPGGACGGGKKFPPLAACELRGLGFPPEGPYKGCVGRSRRRGCQPSQRPVRYGILSGLRAGSPPTGSRAAFAHCGACVARRADGGFRRQSTCVSRPARRSERAARRRAVVRDGIPGAWEKDGSRTGKAARRGMEGDTPRGRDVAHRHWTISEPGMRRCA